MRHSASMSYTHELRCCETVHKFAHAKLLWFAWWFFNENNSIFLYRMFANCQWTMFWIQMMFSCNRSFFVVTWIKFLHVWKWWIIQGRKWSAWIVVKKVNQVWNWTSVEDFGETLAEYLFFFASFIYRFCLFWYALHLWQFLWIVGKDM